MSFTRVRIISSYVIHSRTHHSRFTVYLTVTLQRSAALTIYRHVSPDVSASCFLLLFLFGGVAVTVLSVQPTFHPRLFIFFLTRLLFSFFG